MGDLGFWQLPNHVSNLDIVYSEISGALQTTEKQHTRLQLKRWWDSSHSFEEIVQNFRLSRTLKLKKFGLFSWASNEKICSHINLVPGRRVIVQILIPIMREALKYSRIATIVQNQVSGYLVEKVFKEFGQTLGPTYTH